MWATWRSTVVPMSESTANTPDQTPEPIEPATPTESVTAAESTTPAESNAPAEPPAAAESTGTENAVLPVAAAPQAAPVTATPVWPSPNSDEAANPAPLSAPAAPQPAPVGGQTSSSAIVALVLSIASWAVCPIVLAIIALVFASKADKEIARSGGALEGSGMITAAKIVAWVNIGVFIAVCVILVFVVIIALIAGGLSNVSPAGQV